MPGIYKIGFTERTVKERLKEANSSNTWSPPHQYEILFSAKVEDAKNKEGIIHKILSVYRVRPDREFFKDVPRIMIEGIFELVRIPEEEEIPKINLDQISIVKKTVNTPRSGEIRFENYMTDGQLIRHKLLDSVLEGIYDEKIKKVKCRTREFYTLTDFVRYHEETKNSKPKGSFLWKECEIEENGVWVPFEKKD